LPDFVLEAWDQLKQALLGAGDDWIVWTDWYDERLKGHPGHQAVELGRAAIPNEIWDKGAPTVNAHIRELFRSHGILRYEIANERNVLQELQRLTQEELAIIGVRAVLRALPLIEFKEPRLLFVLGAISSAWTAARYQLPADHPTHAERLYTDLLNSSNDVVASISDALLASSDATLLPAAVRYVIKGIEALREAALRKYGKAGESVFDLCLTQDLNDLRASPEEAAIAELPIWLGNAPPEWAMQQWDSLKGKLLEAGWDVWVDWYYDRLAGTGRSKAHDFAYVEVPNELWPQGPTPVNDWIRNRIYEVDGLIPSTGADRTTHASKFDPTPIEGVPNPLGIITRPDGRIGAEAGPLATPALPPSITRDDHDRLLAACRNRAEELHALTALPTFQGRRDYAEVLSSYLIWLPAVSGTGNILLADGDARILNRMFTAEEPILSVGFAARLTVFLEDHIALRTFYPELERHFVAVKTGRLIKPLKRDAMEAIKQVIHEHTPGVFDHSVGTAMDEVGKPVPHIEALHPEDVPPPDSSRPRPPRDPVADLDPQKTWNFVFASGVNRIWGLILKGKDLSAGLGGWRKTYEQMKPYVGDILDWLRAFLPHDGSGGPTMPPTITT
jgi:hypothetical protein